jgi:hypothetical protein
MTDQVLNPKIVSRLRKLLALAAEGSGATEAEAEAATARAQALMAEHNLSMATLEAAGAAATDDGRRTDSTAKGRAMYDWQQRLMAAVAEANFCSVWVQYAYRGRRRTATGYHLIGREANVVSATLMFDYLCRTRGRLVLAAVGGDNTQRMTKFGVAFAEGCGDRCGERIRRRHLDYLAAQARAARETNAAARHPASATACALVVVMQDYAAAEADLNQDLRYGYAPGTTAARRATATAQRAANLAAAVAAGEDPDVLDWVRAGCALATARRYAAEARARAATAATETPAQKAKREAREAARAAREQARWDRQTSKKNWTGYFAGRAAGEKVGLDPQVARGPAPRSLS